MNYFFKRSYDITKYVCARSSAGIVFINVAAELRPILKYGTVHVYECSYATMGEKEHRRFEFSDTLDGETEKTIIVIFKSRNKNISSRIKLVS